MIALVIATILQAQAGAAETAAQHPFNVAWGAYFDCVNGAVDRRFPRGGVERHEIDAIVDAALLDCASVRIEASRQADVALQNDPRLLDSSLRAAVVTRTFDRVGQLLRSVEPGPEHLSLDDEIKAIAENR
jgi:hypothetical protein